MINNDYFNCINEHVENVLNSSNLTKEEILDKKNRLNECENKIVIEQKYNNDYLGLIHEIKSLDFLKNFGTVIQSKDTKHEEGPDFKLNDYRIECVTCSSGDMKKNKLYKYRLSENKKHIFCDYNEVLEILLPRITQALNEKSVKFKKYFLDGVLKGDEKCIIFVSLGDIASDFRSDKYGFDLLNVLLGKSHMVLTYDREKEKMMNCYYTHVDKIKKQNGALIDANFFLDKNNNHISGILFTDIYPEGIYDFSNTYLFLNPNANNKVKVKDFDKIKYWKENKNHEYIPRYMGKDLWNKFNMSFF